MKTRYKNIIRCNYPKRSMVGYYVRVMWGKTSVQHFFSDEACNGRLAALSKALRFRHEAERGLGKPRTERVIRKTSRASQGVYRTTHNGHALYVATWSPEPYATLRKAFRVKGRGYRRAQQEAMTFRRKMAGKSYR